MDLESIQDFYNRFGEPCNNCINYYHGAFCDLGHRQKRVGISTGHIPELTYRRKGGCPDWKIDEGLGVWHHEEPLFKCSGEYGGSKTSII
jgi:hypothetical protein